LHHQVDDDGVEAQRVGGGAGVVTAVFSLDGAQHESPVGQDETLSVQRHGDGCVLTDRERGRERERERENHGRTSSTVLSRL